MEINSGMFWNEENRGGKQGSCLRLLDSVESGLLLREKVDEVKGKMLNNPQAMLGGQKDMHEDH